MNKVWRLRTKLDDVFTNKWVGWLALAGSIGIFLALTLTRLETASIWFDEAYSAYLTRYNLADLTYYTAIDVHPPLYYYLLKGWTTLFGSSVVVYRSLSICLGVLALVLVYCLVKKLFSTKVASLATLLVAISPMFVRYGTETRMYMLVVVIALAATLVFYQLLHSTKKHWAILYGVLISLGMWTHYFTAIIWLSHWTYRAIYLRRHGLKGKKLVKSFFDGNWLLAHGLAVALYLPWLPVALKQMSGLGGGFWIPSVTVNTLTNYIAQFLVFRDGEAVSGWFVLLVITTVSLASYLGVKVFRNSSGKQLDNLWLVLVIATMPVAILFILSMPPLTPMFIDRYLLTALVFLAILVGLIIALANNKQARLAVCLLVLAVCSFGNGIYNVYSQGTYGNFSTGSLAKDIMNEIQASSDNDVPIVVKDNYSYYELATYEQPGNPVRFMLEPIIKDDTGSLRMERDNKFGSGIENFVEFAENEGEFWLIGNPDQAGQISLPENVELENAKALETIVVNSPFSQPYGATRYVVE